MTSSPVALPFLRPEVRGYLAACEHLISEMLSSKSQPLSKEELEFIGFYVAEVPKILTARIEQ